MSRQAAIKPRTAAKRLALVALVTGLLVAILAMLVPPSSASPFLRPQTRVAAIATPESQLVGLNEAVLPGGSRPRAPDYDLHATGSSVAAEGEGGSGVADVLEKLSAGRNPGVWTVSSEEELQDTFAELTQDGTPTTWKGYSGPVYELPDGDQIGLRSTSSSGGPTIDIRTPSGDQWKIHIG